ncbi:MAG: alcohol dehydrogenase catalytic domain-containing protein [Clostridiales bacterium]|jgi:threonine dehydrogenase-like Zn-dependent dehydrogenase|nr:alcohol dehydrogenase catalytic domain-containing protein [Clostridiales bacterium]
MLARGLYGRRGFRMEIRERALPEPGPRDALLRVRACGVCGTDLHFLRELGEWTPLGHEIAGEVAAVGAEVSRWKPGMAAVCEDVTLCGACEMCKSGRTGLCRDGLTLSGQPGASDYLLVDERMLVPFEGIPFDAAAMVEPLAVAIRCVDKLRVSPAKSLLILGTGAIALLCAAYAKLLGAGRIVTLGRPGARFDAALPVARAFGADEVRSFATDERFDGALVAAPPSLAGEAVNYLRCGGTALVAGVAFDEGSKRATLDVSDMVFSKKSLITSIAEPAQGFPLAAQLISSGRIDAGRIITHRLSMEDAPEKLENCYREGAIKVVLQEGA